MKYPKSKDYRYVMSIWQSVLIDCKYKGAVLFYAIPIAPYYLHTIYIMADTNNTPDILINNRRGWIAESDSLMREGDCAYMHNLDGRSDPSVLKLNRALIDTYSTLSLPVAFADWYVFCEWWQVYNAWVWSLAYTLTWVSKLISVTKFGITTTWFTGIIVWFYVPTSNTSIIKSFAIPINDDPTPTAVFTSTEYDYFRVYDYFTWSDTQFSVIHNSRYNVHVINYEDDFLYVSVGKKIYVANQPFCTNTAGRLEYYFSLEDNIAWITRAGYLINIYLRNWLKYFWQGIENRTTTWSVDLGIKNVHNIWDWKNFDYVLGVWFTWDTNCIFVSQWQDIQLLKESSHIRDWISEVAKFYIDQWTNNRQRCAFNHNLSFFPVLWWSWPTLWWLLSLWTRNEVTSKSWINDYISDDIQTMWFIWYAIDANSQPFVHFWYELDTWWFAFSSLWYFNQSEQNKTYQSSWVRYTKKYLSPNVKQRTATRFRFRYDLPVGTSIDVYYSKDWLDTYTLLWSLPQWQKDFEWINLSRRTEPRYEIQFKIVISTTDITKTPKLYTMEVYGSNSTR